MPPIYRKLLTEYDDIVASGLTVGEVRYPSIKGAIGQVLTQGPNGVIVFSGDSTGITGTGKTNYLTKFVTPKVVAASLLYESGSKIGVGTELPTETFDISGSLRVRNRLNATGSVATLSDTGILQERSLQQFLIDLGAQPTGSYVTTDRALTVNGVTYNLTEDRSWNVGTVTTVGLTVPTGLTVTNSPVTESGSLTITFDTGYSIPTTASQTNWDLAYTSRIASLTTVGNSGPATLASNILNIPEYTLSGLGGQPLDDDLTAIAALTGVGFLRRSGTNTWFLDSSEYSVTSYTGSHPIIVTVNSGPGGSTQVTASHADSGVVPGTYNKLTVDAKGHVVDAENVPEQDNFVRVLRIPSSAINFTNNLKDEIATYINQLDPPLVINENESKWNIIIEGILPNVINDKTEINLWFDNSGSMDAAFPGLVTMVRSCLKALLLPIYNNDESLYNSRVRVFTFTDSTYSIYGESVSFTGKTAGTAARERTFWILNTLGTTNEISRVINLVFQDEAEGDYYPGSVTFDPNTNYGAVTADYIADTLELNTTLGSLQDSNYYKGVIYQMETATPVLGRQNFRALLAAATGSQGLYTGSASLEALVTAQQLFVEHGVNITTNADYYLNLLSNTLRNTLGITNIGDIDSITCYQPVSSTSTQVLVYCSGNGGVIEVSNVVGGTPPYNYTYTTGSTESSLLAVGVPATSIPNGTYSVRVYDANNYRFTVRNNLQIDCTVSPLVGTAGFTCNDTTGQSAQLSVTGVSGGTGVGYYFTLNGSSTQYLITNGSGTVTVPDGFYTVTLFDQGSSVSVTLGTVGVNCKTNYSIRVYECGTCNILGTGFVEYNPNTPLQTGKFYKLTNGNVAEILALTVGTVTHVVSDLLTYFDSCSLACNQAYIVTRYSCGTCLKLGKGTVAYNTNLQVGKFYNTVNGEVVEISPVLATASITHTILDTTVYYGLCELTPCLQSIS
jgi:hypothetical protein